MMGIPALEAEQVPHRLAPHPVLSREESRQRGDRRSIEVAFSREPVRGEVPAAPIGELGAEEVDDGKAEALLRPLEQRSRHQSVGQRA